jgi:tetratricopeptide (TPR) repeat protein
MLLLCLLLAAQDGAVARHDLPAYLSLAARYRELRATDAAATVTAMRGWSADEVSDVQRSLRANEDRVVARAHLEGQIGLRVLEAAALLHLEAGVRALQEPDEAEGVTQMGAAFALVRWTNDVAAKRRKRGPGEPGVDPADWRLAPRLDPPTVQRAAAELAVAVGFPQVALRYAEDALRAAPADPRLLLVSGLAHEGLAHLRRLEGASSDAKRLADGAQQAYRDVLAADPSIEEARLRLGRLLAERDFRSQSEPLLERVASQAPEPRQRYLALLFLGRAAEGRREWPRAAELYSRALEARPDGTAARLGLALQLERQAGPAAAHAAVLQALDRARRPDAPPDPWTSYLFGRVEAASAEAKALWDKVLAP